MVYNAMKLFMEINPQLFDDCSHEYTEHQNSAEARKEARDAKWKSLAEAAAKAKTNDVNAIPAGVSPASAGENAWKKFAKQPALEDESVEDSAKRLEGLKLSQVDSREKKSGSGRERQGSVGSAMSSQR